MTVCFFGNYIPDYPRIIVLKKGLEANGIKVLECHTRKTGFGKYLDLWQQHRKIKNEYDVLLVTMAAYTLVPFARFIARKKLIFDAFVSLKLSYEDRGIAGGGFWDVVGSRHADKVLLDTNAQIDYFVSNYNLPHEKFIRVFASANPDIFHPMSSTPSEKRTFVVHWHGHIVPFHGVETVIAAARLLKEKKDIEFHITTRFNSKYEKIKRQAEGLENIRFFPETSYLGLAKAINDSDVVLGIFGANKKAELVIPNKIFEAVACARPVITRDSSAIRELFDETTMRFCKAASPKDLADSILALYNDANLRKILSENAHKLFLEKLTPVILGSPVGALVEELAKKS